MPFISRKLSQKLDPRLAGLLALDDESLAKRIQRDTDRLTTFQKRVEGLRTPLSPTFQADFLGAEAGSSEAGSYEDSPRQEIRRASPPKVTRTVAPLGAARRSWFPLSAGASLGSDGSPRLKVLVQGEVTDAELPGTLARAGNTTLCEGSPDQIRALLANPSVRAIELVRPISAALEQARQEIGAPDLSPRGGAASEAGKGVIIGLVDFGIDFHHSDLRNEDGSTRLLGLYDLATGQVWSQDEINRELQAEVPYSVVGHRWDLQGKLEKPSLDKPGGDLWMRHGTHMAAIAAGNGRSGVSPAGLAPGAELLFVSLDPGLAMAGVQDAWGQAGFDQVILGMRWILCQAEAQGKPVVINLSLADYTGPHDGTSLHQAFLEGLQDSPGRVVVVASGNANELGGHIQKNFQDGMTFRLQVDEAAVADDAFELWIDGVNPVELELRLPGGAAFVLAAGEQTATATLSDGERAVTVVGTRVLRPQHSDQGIRFNLFVEGEAGLPTGEWSLKLSGEKTYTRQGERRQRKRRAYAWLERCNAGAIAWVEATNGRGTLSDLATHDALLVVGGTIKRLGGPQANISGVSGCGPTRDNRNKPDIVAPSASVRMAEPHGRVNPSADGPREHLVGAGTGTSISTAMVSGAAAMLMACRGVDGRPAMLSTREVRTILQESAITSVGPDRQGPVDLTEAFNPAFGAGVLNLRGLCGESKARGPWIAAFPGDDGGLPRARLAFWTSPDIRVRAGDGGARIEVQVRDGGRGLSEGTQVALSWSLPVSLPVDDPKARTTAALSRRLRSGSGALPWSSTGIRGTAEGATSRLSRRGDGWWASFAFKAPAGVEVSSLCWRAEVEGGEGPLGRRRLAAPLGARNRGDVGLRCVVDCPSGRDGAAVLSLHLAGSAGRNGLRLLADDGARIEALLLPRSLLFERVGTDLRQERSWNALASYGARGVGEVGVEVDEAGQSWIRLQPTGEVLIPDLQLDEHQLVPVQVRFRAQPGALVHLVHLVNAVPVGGVSGQSATLAATAD